MNQLPSTPIPSGPGTPSIVTDQRILQYKRARYNPIKLLTFENLATQMDWFEYGTLDRFARTMDAICQRDDTIKNTLLKRKAAVQRMDYVIHLDPEAGDDDALKAEAEKHKAQLEFFFKHMRVTDAIDKNMIGRFNLLKSQMMNAVPFRWQVHEIVWKPMPGAMNGADGLTATFNAVPLWFFENRTGYMRYIPWEGSYDGIPFDNDSMSLPNWCVTAGPGLGVALSIAYMYKQNALKNWIFYQERHGSPATIGKTKAPVGSEQWNELVAAIKEIGQNFSAVTYLENEIDSISMTTQGELPYPLLVERMDRAIASILMGGDLSSMSKDGNAAGSNPQQDESIKLEDADAEMLSETLNMNICNKVIEYLNGEGTLPLAYIQIVSPKRKDAAKDVLVDTFLLTMGAPLGVEATLARYDREPPQKGEAVMRGPMQPQKLGADGKPVPDQADEEASMANERGDAQGATLRENGVRAWADAQERALAPLFDRLDAVFHVLDGNDDVAAQVALRNLLRDIPAIQSLAMKFGQPKNVLAGVMGAGILNGMAEGEMSLAA